MHLSVLTFYTEQDEAEYGDMMVEHVEQQEGDGDEYPTPPAIEFEHEVFDVAFHPGGPLVATGLISGDVFVYV